MQLRNLSRYRKLVGIGHGLPHSALVGGRDPATTTPNLVENHVSRYSQEPRATRRRVSQRGQSCNSFGEGLLRNVLCVLAAAQASIRQVEHGCVVALNQLVGTHIPCAVEE